MYRKYLKQNRAEMYMLKRHHHFSTGIVKKLLFYDPDIEKEYRKYDYMLFAARFAASILAQREERFKTIQDFIDFLQPVFLCLSFSSYLVGGYRWLTP